MVFNMKKILIKSMFLVAINISSIAFASKNPIIGFGVTNSFLNDVAVETFTAGFSFAIANNKLLLEQIRIESESEHSPIGATRVAQKLIAQGAKALIGFPGSHDCLLAAKEAFRAKIPALFLNCSHEDLNNYAGQIATTESPLIDEVNSMLDFLATREVGKKGYVIVQPSHIVSRSQATLYKNSNSKRKAPLDLEIIELLADGTLNSKNLNFIRSNKIDFIILTAYPDLIKNLRDQIAGNLHKTHLYGSSAWDNLEVARRFLLDLNSEFIYPTTWDRESKQSRKFIEAYRKKYSKEPSPEAAFGYDLGLILIALDRDQPAKSLSVKLATSISQKKCFKGLLSNTLCLGDLGVHTYRKRIFVQVTSKGLKHADYSQP